MKQSQDCIKKEIDASFSHTVFDNNTTKKHINNLREMLFYGTLNGGKRLRFLLVCIVAEMYSIPFSIAKIPATAVELIHSYSLIHDDLPAIDNDNIRRGKPSVHKKFGEANAILAGDTLLTLAFEVLNREKNGLTDWQTRRISCLLARVSGNSGMVAGQYLDINVKKNTLYSYTVKKTHALKTGELFRFSVISGLLLNKNYQEKDYHELTHYAYCIGQIFQLLDDLHDLQITSIKKHSYHTASPSVAKQKDITQICYEFADKAHTSLKIYGNKAHMLHNFIDFLMEKHL